MTRAGLDKRPHEVAGMFDAVAERYDVTNDILSAGQDRWWRCATVRAVAAHPGERVLDIAAGTGTSAEPFADRGIGVVAADFSLGMVAVGRRRRPDVAFAAADATALPFSDGSFDAVTMSFGLRNVAQPAVALAEFLRVTRPGGRLVVCEFSLPPRAVLRRGYLVYLRHVLPAVARRVSSDPESYRYLSETIQAWPRQRELAESIAAVGWSQVEWRNLSGGVVAVHRAVRPVA